MQVRALVMACSAATARVGVDRALSTRCSALWWRTALGAAFTNGDEQTVMSIVAIVSLTQTSSHGSPLPRRAWGALPNREQVR